MGLGMPPHRNERRYRVAIATSHVIQYNAPLFQRLAAHPAIDLHVYYYSQRGAKVTLDEGFGVAYAWDVPLLNGYEYSFPKNMSPFQFRRSFLSLINPGLALAVMRGRFDAVIVHGWRYASDWLALGAARYSRTPILLYGDSCSLFESQLPPYKAWLKRTVLLRLFRRVSGFLVSGAFNAEFYAMYGAPRARFFSCPWAIDVETFFQRAEELRPRRAALRRQFGWTDDTVIVLFVGKLLPRKRPLDLVRAVERLHHSGLRVKAVFVGEGSQRPAIEAYIRDNALADQVQLVGFQNQTELGPYYSAADIFAFPSARDPRGTVTNEAMAYGLPVVIAEGVGVWGEGDLVQHGERGFVHSVGNVPELADYLERLARDVGLRAAMGQRARAKIAEWGYAECLAGIVQALEQTCQVYGDTQAQHNEREHTFL